ANWRQFAAATAAISLLRALLGPVLDCLWKHQEEGLNFSRANHLLPPHQTIALRYPMGQKKGRRYYYNPQHTCSVACKLQSPGTDTLTVPSNNIKKKQ
ncbi:hypothetical protein N339_03173, partial [Pterocles gutturalis]